MNKPLQTLIAGLSCVLMSATASHSKTVVLNAKNNSSSVTGELISYDGTRYMLRTAIGVVPFEADAFTCSGNGCPVEFSDDAGLSIAGPAELADVVLPLLAEGYAEQQESYAAVLDKSGLPIDDRRAFQGSDPENQDYGLFDIQFTDDEGAFIDNILVQEATGPRLFDLFTSKDVDIVLSEASITPDQLIAARSNGLGNLISFDQERVIAVDGFTAVVHPKNPVAKLTVPQISAIMSGNITNWQEIGGPNHKINVYSFSENTEAFHNIRDLVLTPYDRQLADGAFVMRSNRELSRAMANDQYGFGVMNFSSIRDAKALPIENECGMVIQPDRFSMKTEEYPLQKRVSVYNSNSLTEFGQSFLSYLETPIADDIVAKAGLVNLSIIEEDERQKLERLDRAVKYIDPAASRGTLQSLVLDVLETERLSTVFRFSPKSTLLDNKARRDISRTLDYIKEHKPKRIVIAGFADANGSFQRNRKLSSERATSVWRALNAIAQKDDLADTKVEVRGYGELVPIACNATFKGRSMNRRVEIWSEN